jgi:hypothetical protein
MPMQDAKSLVANCLSHVLRLHVSECPYSPHQQKVPPSNIYCRTCAGTSKHIISGRVYIADLRVYIAAITRIHPLFSSTTQLLASFLVARSSPDVPSQSWWTLQAIFTLFMWVIRQLEDPAATSFTLHQSTLNVIHQVCVLHPQLPLASYAYLASSWVPVKIPVNI